MGDAILSTCLLEGLRERYPKAELDLVVRKGNHGLFDDHPFLNKLYIWDKGRSKRKDLLRIISEVRKEKYDVVINCQRFSSTGFLTARSKGKEKVGYRKNPLSFLFSRKLVHDIGNGRHEVERLHDLIAHLDAPLKAPKLYPTKAQFAQVKRDQPYVCVAPASVWFTKAWPAHKWVELITTIDPELEVLLIGAPSDNDLCSAIAKEACRGLVLAGKLNLLESAALIANAQMNYVNDSAPLHMATATGAPVTAVFCSTIPAYGFGPYNENGRVVEIQGELSCRSCGLHGKRSCPQGHFKCAEMITTEQFLK